MNDLEDDLSVDLTPLIDVTFMLVIFFIMTMSFTLPIIDFSLPQATTAQVEHENSRLRISVDKNGSYMVNNEVVAQEALATIVQERAVAARNAGEDLALELVIDATAPTQHLITVADLARTYTNGRLMVVSEKAETGAAASTSNSTSSPSTNVTAPAPEAITQDSSNAAAAAATTTDSHQVEAK